MEAGAQPRRMLVCFSSLNLSIHLCRVSFVYNTCIKLFPCISSVYCIFYSTVSYTQQHDADADALIADTLLLMRRPTATQHAWQLS